VTSPGYIKNYFLPIQKYRGQWFLLENKIYPVPEEALAAVCRHEEERFLKKEHAWVVGFFGALKCQQSWDIIKKVAGALPDKVVFKLGGYPTRIDKDDFYDAIERYGNIEYVGEYKNPDDLSNIYGGVDHVWCFDFSNGEYNSVWCLANRLYEGGYFEIPLLASEGYESGEFVERYGIGWTFSEPYAENLIRFFSQLETEQYLRVKARYQSLDKSIFSGIGQHEVLCTHMKSLQPVP